MTSRITSANWKLVAGPLVLAMVTAACGGEAAPSDSSAPKPATTPDPITLRVAMTTFGEEQLDPTSESRIVAANTLLPIYDTVLDIAPDGTLAPGLAEEWEMSDDGLTWTFHIRSGVPFHGDWGEVTAEDVAFSLERSIDDESRMTCASPLKAAVREITVLDDRTLEIHTNGVQPDFEYLLSPHECDTGLVYSSRYLLEEAGSDFEAQRTLLNEHPIASGPFKFVERAVGDYILLEAVPEHWRATPKIQFVRLMLVPEAGTQVSMIQSDEADIIPLAPERIDELQDSEEVEILSSAGAVHASVIFTGLTRTVAEGKVTQDPNVRKALCLAIDRQAVIDSILNGQAVLPNTPSVTSANTSSLDPDFWADWMDTNMRYDPTEARRLLAEAGYPEGFSGIKYFSNPRESWSSAVDQAVVAMWSQVGVEVELTPMDYGAYRPHLVDAAPDDAFNAGDALGWTGSPRWTPLAGLDLYFKGQDGPVQLINDARVDELLLEIPEAADPERRQDLVQEAYVAAMSSFTYCDLFQVAATFGINTGSIESMPAIPGWPHLGRVLERVVPRR